MLPLHAVVRLRRIDIAALEELPDGTEVEVRVVAAHAHDSGGLAESEWDDSPSGTTAWMEWVDALQPLVLTAEDEQQMCVDRERWRRWELEQFSQHADQLKSDWE